MLGLRKGTGRFGLSQLRKVHTAGVREHLYPALHCKVVMLLLYTLLAWEV